MPRTYTDQQLKEAITAATTWADVMRALGKNPRRGAHDVRKVADRLGIDHSHIVSHMELHPDRIVETPFKGRPSSGRELQVEALARAMNWFMGKGYPVSVPIEPTAYDLIVESDDGLQRVQVKSCQFNGRNGQYEVKLVRTLYTQADADNPGKYTQIAYKPGEVDFFFIVCSDGTMYLIPYAAVQGVARVSVTTKYSVYRVS